MFDTQIPIKVKWINEDELLFISDEYYDDTYKYSRIISGTRMFAYVEINGNKHFLT